MLKVIVGHTLNGNGEGKYILNLPMKIQTNGPDGPFHVEYGNFQIDSNSDKSVLQDTYLKTYSKTVRKHQYTIEVAPGKDVIDSITRAIQICERVSSNWSIREATIVWDSLRTERRMRLIFAFSNEEAQVEFFLRYK